jgi:RimJ/RimL family protein N-acetyltransferase
MNLDTQPTLENEKVIIYPLEEKDFDGLYKVASDSAIWAQHPNKDRWKMNVFKVFFDGAIKSKGAFKIVNKSNGDIIGSTRFYDYNEKENSILIGYTFYATAYWGKGFNHTVKTLMLDYIFKFVSKVYFHVGAENIRSQIAIGRLGTTKIGEEEVTYFGEQPKLNCIYTITKEEWLSNNPVIKN